MSRLFYHVMQDNAGNLLFDVSGTMRLAGSGTLATIYGDEALTVILPNPMTNHPSFGSFKCYLGASAAGYDFYMAKAGYTFETLTGVQGLGTMAQQNAANVAITGGTAAFSTLNLLALANQWAVQMGNPPAGTLGGIHGEVAAGTSRWNLHMTGTAQNYLAGPLGLGDAQSVPYSNARLSIDVNKTGAYGIFFQHTVNDTGGTQPVLFKNVAGTDIGSIATNATATAFNTSSDVRLKKDVTPLTGALDVVRRLRPVSFLWNADGSPGRGFVAGEVAEVVDGVITGEPDAMDEDGNIRPQMIDMSKLVPYLTAALRDTLETIDALTARITALEGAIL